MSAWTASPDRLSASAVPACTTRGGSAMAEQWLERARTGVVILASAALAVAPGFVAAQSQSGSGQRSSESKPTDQSGGNPSQKPANGTERQSAPQRAGEVGDRLHDSAK